MNYVISFQLSRTTPLTEWRSDPNLRDIISTGRIIAYNSDGPVPIPDCQYREAIGRLNHNILTGQQYFEYLNLLERNQITRDSVTKFYFTHTNGFDLGTEQERNIEDVDTPMILGDD